MKAQRKGAWQPPKTGGVPLGTAATRARPRPWAAWVLGVSMTMGTGTVMGKVMGLRLGEDFGAVATPLVPGGAQGAGPDAANPPRPASVSVLAAGSLKDALLEVAALYQARTGTVVQLGFGPSGLLRQRLQAQDDTAAQGVTVFISADMGHPQALAQTGAWQSPQRLLQNRLCVLAQGGLKRGPDLLAQLLDPALRLGISTPQSDPAGDYAWAMFGRADALQAGATQVLRSKAQALTGGPQSPPAPAGRNAYAWVMGQGMVDVFVTYCTNAQSAARENPALQIWPVPEALAVNASYGLTLRRPAPQAAQQWRDFLSQAPAQAVFEAYGFSVPPNQSGSQPGSQSD